MQLPIHASGCASSRDLHAVAREERVLAGERFLRLADLRAAAPALSCPLIIAAVIGTVATAKAVSAASKLTPISSNCMHAFLSSGTHLEVI